MMSMVKKVTLYTDNSDCSAMARKFLAENKVLFEEISTTKEGSRITIAKYRLPFLEVRGNGVHTVSGFNEFQYASALNSRLSYDDFVKRKKDVAAKKQMRLTD